MILADKIIKLRKKNGWSQEELAERMNVSRQAVSKWESAQTVPDLGKILQMSELFGVTTDYLLKDEIEEEEFSESNDDFTVRRIGIDEANAYLENQRRAAFKIAFATLLCILSPVTLILLGALSEYSAFGISETLAGAVGLGALFALVICAVTIFILCGFKGEKYEFLDKKEPFELEYGVKGIVTEKRKDFRGRYVLLNVLASCICIASPVPLIVTAFFENDLITAISLCALFPIVGIGVFMFIVAGVREESMKKLLREGEYAAKKKNKSTLQKTVEDAYWGVVVALYLLISFVTGAWHITWVMFVAGGAIFPLVMLLCDYISDKRTDN